MKRKNKKNQEETSYWLSYSDMMAALLLVFILIITFTMLHSQKQFEEKQAILEEQQKVLEEQQELIDSAIKEAQEMKEESEKQQKVIAQQEAQLNRIIGVKGEIIADIQKEFADSSLSLNIDPESGAITFDSDLLFDPDMAVLRSSSKAFLDDFLPRYFAILLDEKYVDNVAEIIIEGHTAKYGTYMGCLTLSQNRAFAVAQYALRDKSSLYELMEPDELRKIVTVNGRAYYDPVYNADGTYNAAASRRVEIKFRLKDDEMIAEMMDVLSQDKN